MSFLYHALFYNPIYNLLIIIFRVLPWADAGVVVLLLTFIIRAILFPLSKRAIVTQVKMQELNPKLAEIKERLKGNQEAQAKETLAVYKTAGVNPFSGIFVLLIQLPVVWALYRIFIYSGLPQVNTALLYSFVSAPAHISTMFLGLLDITHRSVLLAALAAIATFFQLRLATSRQQVPQGDGFSDNLARSMQTQMKYFFPVLVFFISYRISGVVALYWCATSVFTYCQELYVRKTLLSEAAA